jgi:hypothetical protein
MSNEIFGKYIRKTHLLFSIKDFFVKASTPIINENELEEIPIEYKIFKARMNYNAPSIFILDRDGYVCSTKPEVPLISLKEEDLSIILSELPSIKKKQIIKILQNEWNFKIKEEDEDKLFEAFKQNPIFFTPAPMLKNVDFLKNFNWKEYIDKLVEPKQGKDRILKIIHLSKLIKPPIMKYAPHSIEITNSGTGKTSFYNVAGILVDKFTPKAVLGFAKSPEEIYVGTINGTELPTAFDQVESQTARETARYMFNILETGKALVDSGGVRFPVETHSSFAYLGNPIAKEQKVVEGFKALIDHISFNSAMGRRFAIILFKTDMKTIKNKMTIAEEEEWKKNFIVFRAIEEYAKIELKKIFNNPKIIEWLHKPIEGYEEAIFRAIQNFKDVNLANFFEAHAQAQHRVRASALHSALALLLNKIALKEYAIEEIIEEAEDLLNEYIEINLNSITELTQQWEEMRVEGAKMFFENLPDYLKEIVSAILLYKQQYPDKVKVKLTEIPYETENKEVYPYFSICIHKLNKRKKYENLNTKFNDYFGFVIEKINDDIEALFFETPKPPKDLKLIGKLGSLPILPISYDIETGTFNKEDKNMPLCENGKMVKTVKNDDTEDLLLFENKIRKEEGAIIKYICNFCKKLREFKNCNECNKCEREDQKELKCNFKTISFVDMKEHIKTHFEKRIMENELENKEELRKKIIDILGKEGYEI